MKKIISILTVFAMILAFAAIPAMAADVTVDFTSADNLAYGKDMAGVAGKNYYAKNSTAPKAGAQYGTDGDLTTYHLAATRDKITWGTKVGSEVNVNLGDATAVTKVTLYAQPVMNDGSTDRGNSSLKINVYGGASSAAGTSIGEMTNEGLKVVSDGTNEMEMYVYSIEFPGNSIYQYITFNLTSSYFWGWNEIYVEGATASITDADKVAADKESLTLGNTSALTDKITLPTAGLTYGSTITWATSDASVITTDGKITRVGEDKTATLTATITNGDVSDTKTFSVTVLGYEVYNVDLSAENNILLGKKVTPIVGRYYSDSTPSDSKQLATDGVLATCHSGNGKVNNATVGVAFSIDLEDEYLLDTLDIILQANETDRGVKIYNGTAVDPDKLIGTFIGAKDNNYVVAGEQAAAHAVVHCDFPEATVASQITIAYEGGYDFVYYEIAATGTPTVEGEVYRNFKSADNLAYKKDNTMVIGHYYNGWTPATDDLATDGDITTTKRATGAYSGEGTGNYYGFAYKIDLGAYYKLSEITLYTAENPGMKISFCSENEHKVTSVGNSSNRGGYILNSQGGIVNGGFASVPKESGVPVTVNGTAVYANTVNPGADAEPVRHLIVFVQGGTLTYNELYVAGTPFAGELAMAEADFGYTVDEEIGAVVNAKVALMNTTDAATSGTLYYAAYDEEGALVGYKTVAVTDLIAGGTYDEATTFAVSGAATSVKMFYWSNDGAYVPVISAINAN